MTDSSIEHIIYFHGQTMHDGCDESRDETAMQRNTKILVQVVTQIMVEQASR